MSSSIRPLSPSLHSNPPSPPSVAGVKRSAPDSPNPLFKLAEAAATCRPLKKRVAFQDRGNQMGDLPQTEKASPEINREDSVASTLDRTSTIYQATFPNQPNNSEIPASLLNMQTSMHANNHPEQIKAAFDLTNLFIKEASALVKRRRPSQGGSPSDLDLAIQLFKNAFQFSNHHEIKAYCQGMMASAYAKRNNPSQPGVQSDIDRSIYESKQALSFDHLSPKLRAFLLGNLALALIKRNRPSVNGSRSDLDIAIARNAEALSLKIDNPGLRQKIESNMKSLVLTKLTEFTPILPL